MAFHRAFKKSNVISSEGTAQPEWLNRRRGSNPTRGVDVGGSSPQLDQQHREILVAVASLLRAGRSEMALTILDNELGGGC